MNFRQTVLVPLMVMLLLTVLLGATTFQMSQRWQTDSQHSTQMVTRALLLTNLRWKLIRVKRALERSPEEAPAFWEEVRQTSTLLAQTPSPEGTPAFIQTLQHRQPDEKLDIHFIETVLAQPGLSIELSRLIQTLEESRKNTEFITISLTLSMLLLGSVLTGLTAWELNRLFSALVTSRDLNISLQEDERRRIAQDLHDGVVQELVDLKRQYQPEKVDRLIDNIRRVCHNLKPQILQDLGLVAALEFLADDFRSSQPAQVTLSLDPIVDQVPKADELAIFRIIQEGFSNIKQHAKARQVSLSLKPQGNQLIGLLEDDGTGFDLRAVSRGMGLAGMRERLGQVNGQLTIDTQPGQGTRVSFVIPLRREDRHARH